MHTLRQRLAHASLTPDNWGGWQPGDAAPHCKWQHVQCGPQGRVTGLWLSWETVPPPTAAAAGGKRAHLLLPELARFGSLRELTLDLYYAPPLAAIPAEWGLPGAFPSLEL